MAIEAARAFLREKGMEDRIFEFAESTATVAEAAAMLGVEPARIAKSISLYGADGNAVLVVAAGDAKIDNAKYKAVFGVKPRMLAFDDVEPLIGHPVGGVCPFAIREGVKVYLDESLRRFDTVYPACGNSHSAVRLSVEELYDLSNAVSFLDVCKLPEEQSI